jgi:hypothetical protein
MRYEREEASSELSGDVRRTLRSMYAPPAGREYWEGLESRIMSRVTEGAAEWWSFFGGWTRIGLLAAGLTGLLASFAAYRSHAQEQRMASQAVIDAKTVRAEVETAELMPSGPSTRDATLRYVFSR